MSDPNHSIGAALLAIGRLHTQAGILSDALSAHLLTCAGKPELHGFLSRMCLVLREFRSAVTQIEAHCEHLRSAIAAAIAAPSEQT